MKGWEFTGTHQPLKIVEKPDPKAKPGYVVLKTLAGGTLPFGRQRAGHRELDEQLPRSGHHGPRGLR